MTVSLDAVRPRRSLVRLTAAVCSSVLVAGLSTATAGHAIAGPDASCPTLYVLGVAGTGESSNAASTTDDRGMLSAVMSPLLTMAGSHVQRAYVPYPASFGGAVGESKIPFEQSALTAVARTSSMIDQVAQRCEDTKFGLAGYSQGAYSLSLLAQKIGEGSGPVESDRVVAVALFGDPTRSAGTTLFPGRQGAVRPDPAPGTAGESLESLPVADQPALAGGGIGPQADTAHDYGQLTGRVASFCESGDLACDAPADAPVVHLVTNIAGQSKLDADDPVQTLASLGEALALTTVKAAVPVINEDVQGETIEDLSYQPNTTISQRLATASDPRTPMPELGDALNALLKVGTIGLNAVVTVAKKVLTMDTIASLAATGLSNPPAALAILGAKALEATVELIPPATINRWTNEAFEAVKANVTDNSELLDVSNMVRYWNTAQQHTSYGKTSEAFRGMSAAAYTAAWFAAAAADLAGKTFTPTDPNGGLVADPGPRPSPAVIPTVPPSLADESETVTSTPAPAEASAPVASSSAPSESPSTSAETSPVPTATQ